MNLVPAIGEINGNRSNYSFTALEGEPRVYGTCDFEVDFKARKAEPAPEVRGDIARIYFYMQDTYDLQISDKQIQLFTAWDKEDPIDDWEREKLKRIAAFNPMPVEPGHGIGDGAESLDELLKRNQQGK